MSCPGAPRAVKTAPRFDHHSTECMKDLRQAFLTDDVDDNLSSKCYAPIKVVPRLSRVGKQPDTQTSTFSKCRQRLDFDACLL